MFAIQLTVSTQYRRITDRQTDRRTDGQIEKFALYFENILSFSVFNDYVRQPTEPDMIASQAALTSNVMEHRYTFKNG